MATVQQTVSEYLHTDHPIIREFLAEFFGTFFLLLIGTAANVQLATTGGTNQMAVPVAWGIGFAFAVYLAANVSGAHLNPAISFTQVVLGNLSFAKLPHYIIAQMLGAFTGTFVSYMGHYDDIQKIAQQGIGNNSMDLRIAGLFTTFPAPHMSAIGSIFDQIIGTAILALAICLITDKRYRNSAPASAGLCGLTMAMIALSFGVNGGFAINPARDFGPRFFFWVAGYGGKVFSYGSYYFYIPLLAPFVGGIIGAWLYKIFIGLHGLNEVLEITTVKSVHLPH
uniref:Aquaporin n=1 Tax=Rhabditophanes sp. KR3021 TaxID=114890 RepID=A0AC35U366_9BILA